MCDKDEGLVTRMKDKGWGVRRIRAHCMARMREGLMCDQDEGLLTKIKAQYMTSVWDQSVSRMKAQCV